MTRRFSTVPPPLANHSRGEYSIDYTSTVEIFSKQDFICKLFQTSELCLFLCKHTPIKIPHQYLWEGMHFYRFLLFFRLIANSIPQNAACKISLCSAHKIYLILPTKNITRIVLEFKI